VWNEGRAFGNEGESRQRVVVTSGRKWSGLRLVIVTVMMGDCSRHSFGSETTGVAHVTFISRQYLQEIEKLLRPNVLLILFFFNKMAWVPFFFTWTLFTSSVSQVSVLAFIVKKQHLSIYSVTSKGQLTLK